MHFHECTVLFGRPSSRAMGRMPPNRWMILPVRFMSGIMYEHFGRVNGKSVRIIFAKCGNLAG